MSGDSRGSAHDPADADRYAADSGRFQQELAVHAAAGYLNSLADHVVPGQPGLSHDPAYDPAVMHDPGLSDAHAGGVLSGHDPGISHDPQHDPSMSHGASLEPAHDANAHHPNGVDPSDAAHNAGAHDAAAGFHHP